MRFVVHARGGWLACILACALGCAASDSSVLSGTVRSDGGAAMAGVRLTATLAGSIEERSTVTDADGRYRMAGLRAGSYIVSVAVAGAAAIARVTCVVQAKRERPCDIVLSHPSSLTEGVIGAATVRDLPVNGRDVTQATTLEAGVSSVRTQPSAADTGSGRGQRGFGQQISLSGSRPQQNNYMLDGVTTNDYANSSPGSVLGLELGADAVERVAVNTSSYPAQNGRSSGGVVRAVTRSGTDAFHGSVYEFLRNSALDASNYFDHPKPSFRRNQFGGAAALPVWPHHTYLFANFEGLRQSLGVTQVDTVLSEAARAGQLSGGRVSLDPLVRPYLRLFPLPNGGLLPGGDTGIFHFSGQQVTHEDYFTTRADHSLSSNDKLAGTYSFDRARTVQPDAMDFKLTGLRTRRQVLSVSESHRVSGDTLFNTRAGINRVVAVIGDNPGVIDAFAADTSLGYLAGRTPGKIDVVGVTSFPGGLDSTSLFAFHWTSLQAYEDATTRRGRHNLTWGIALEHTRDNMAANSNQNGEYVFHSIADFLENRPYGLTLEIPGSNANRGLRQTVFGAYVQDEATLARSFVLTVGARYETASVPTDVHNRLSALRQVQDASPHLGSPYFSNPTRLNLEPRVGFAWSPRGASSTVVRGGFGMFDVLPLSYEFELLSLFAAPYVQVGTPANLPAGSFPYGGVGIAENAGGARRNVYIQPDPSRNYVMQWNLNLEQKLRKDVALHLAYVGSRGIHQPFRADDINIVMPATRTALGYVWPAAGAAQKLNPAVGRLDGLMWIGHSYYDALQSQVAATVLHGLQLQGSYTWAKSIDTGSATIAGDQFSNSIASLPWFDLRLNRGPSDFNVAHNFTLHFNWPLSFGMRQNAFASGWEIGGTLQASSGAPFTFLVGGDPLGLQSTDPTDVPDRVTGGGCSKPVNDPHAVSYANFACFRFPVPGNRRGNLGRNALTGPGLQNVDISLHKDTFVKRVSDRFNVQFRIEAFNLFNRANFSPPLDHKVLFNGDGSMVAGGGLIDSTATPPRQVQLGVKLIW